MVMTTGKLWWQAEPVRFVIFGAGAIGGVVGGRLFQAGRQVTVIARGQHFETLRSDGLVLESPQGTSRLELPVVDHPSRLSLGDNSVLLLCVKSQDSSTALQALAETAPSNTPVVCLQNGVANERTAQRFFSNVYGAVVMCPAAFLQPGVVRVYSAPIPGILDVGRYPAGTDDTCELVAEALRDAGFLSQVREDIMRWKYRKLLINLGNAVVALCGPEARAGDIAKLALAEGERVLEAAGIDVVTAEEDRLRRGNHPTTGPIGGQPRPGGSMWQSLFRRTGSVEVDYLNGEIVLLGRLYGVATPVNELLQKLARQAGSLLSPPGEKTESEILRLLTR